MQSAVASAFAVMESCAITVALRTPWRAAPGSRIDDVAASFRNPAGSDSFVLDQDMSQRRVVFV